MNIDARAGIWDFCRSAAAPLRTGFYFLLASLILLDLTTSGYGVVRHLFSAGQLSEVPVLDSFSPSSTAVAALKKEATVLLLEYTEARDSAISPDSTSAPVLPEAFNPPGRGPDRLHRGLHDKRLPAKELSIHRIEELQLMIQEVDLEIEQELLLVYHENKRDKELVDTFLAVLQRFPESPEVLEWVRIALACSQRCDRTPEVRDVLEHTIRCFPELKTRAQLIAFLQEWGNQK